MDAAMAVLGLRNVRQLESLSPDNLKKLESHFKNVRISISNSSTQSQRIRTLKGLQPRAGLYKFSEDGVETTVEVLSVSSFSTTANTLIVRPITEKLIISN